jgi:hypothetical protein
VKSNVSLAHAALRAIHSELYGNPIEEPNSRYSLEKFDSDLSNRIWMIDNNIAWGVGRKLERLCRYISLPAVLAKQLGLSALEFPARFVYLLCPVAAYVLKHRFGVWRNGGSRRRLD